MSNKEKAKVMERTHTNLNIFAAIVSILEGGHIYHDECHSQDIASDIIESCQSQMGVLISEHDTAMADISD